MCCLPLLFLFILSDYRLLIAVLRLCDLLHRYCDRTGGGPDNAIAEAMLCMMGWGGLFEDLSDLIMTLGFRCGLLSI